MEHGSKEIRDGIAEASSFSGNGSLGECFRYVVVELLSPPEPVVFDIMPPNVSLVTDTFFDKQICQTMGILQAFVLPGALSADEHDVRMTADVIQGISVQVVGIGKGIVEIDFLRTAGTTDLLDVVATAHRQGVGEEIRELKREIDRMECS
jgi:hypothetical protein